MRYKVVKYTNIKRCPFKTYKPKKKIKVRKEHAVPLAINIGNKLMVAGGMISFFTTTTLLGIKSFLGINKKIKNYTPHKKVYELKIKK